MDLIPTETVACDSNDPKVSMAKSINNNVSIFKSIVIKECSQYKNAIYTKLELLSSTIISNSLSVLKTLNFPKLDAKTNLYIFKTSWQNWKWKRGSPFPVDSCSQRKTLQTGQSSNQYNCKILKYILLWWY